MRAVLDAWRAEGRALPRPSYLAAMAAAYGAMGQAEHGIEVIDEALAEVERSGERWWESGLHRLKGDLIVQMLPRTAGSRLWRGRGKEAAAHRLLKETYDWFTEGFDTADLQDARALLTA